MNPALAAHLATHFGVVTREECASLGVTKRQLEWMVSQGDLIRVLRGVYRHAAAPISVDQRIHAGLRAAGKGAVISHRLGIALHGARNFACALTELSVPSRSLPLHDGLVVHRTAPFAPGELCRRGGFPVTSPARTIVDATVVMSPGVVARIAQEWMAHKALRPEDLDLALARARKHRGVTELRRILADADIGDVDSTAEGDLGRVLRSAGIPPVLHQLVTTTSGATFELDWSYPSERVGLELDGYGVHLRSSAAFEHDRDRRNDLTASGWRILNFTTRMCRKRPDRVVFHVREARSLSRSAQ